MEILHINCNYIGTTLHQVMTEKLTDLGIHNTVYVPTYSRNISVITPNSNVIISECFKKLDRVVYNYKQSKILKDIQSKVDVSTFDCIHAYTLFTDGNVAMNLSRKYGIPYVVAIRNTDVNDFFRFMVHLRSKGVEIMRNASAIFFLSQSYKNQVFEKYIPDQYREELAKKTYVIPNGIDDYWLINKPCIQKKKQDRKIRLIYAGKIDRNKNIKTIQKAMDLLNNKDRKVSLTVVGKIVDNKEYEILKKHKDTVFVPAQSKENLIEIYRNHDIFVMPSFHESFGLVYAEAMSQGLPVIYSKNQGFDKQFKEGQVGYHVVSDSENDICDKINKIVNQYEDISKRCIVCSEKFNWSDIVSCYETVYKNSI